MEQVEVFQIYSLESMTKSQISFLSVNKKYAAVGEGRLVTTRAAKSSMDLCVGEFLATHISKGYKKLAGDVAMYIYYPGDFWWDIDNLLKSLLDALQGIAYDNDSQVVKLCCVKDKHKKFNCLTIWVGEVVGYDCVTTSD